MKTYVPSCDRIRIVRSAQQAAVQKRGFFALFHSVWSLLYMIDDRFTKIVELYDPDGYNYWGALFESPEIGDNRPSLEVPLQATFRVRQDHPDWIRSDFTPRVLPHVFLGGENGYPTGRIFQERFARPGLRQEAHRMMTRYIQPKPDLMRAVDGFFNTHFRDCYTLGIHLRSTWHIGVDLEAERYIREVVCREVEQLVTARGISDYQIFVATHVGEYAELCRRCFGERLIMRPIQREPEACKDWKVADASLYKSAREVLIDTLLLAKSDFVFGIPSNVLIATLLFNPDCAFKIFDIALDHHEGQRLF